MEVHPHRYKDSYAGQSPSGSATLRVHAPYAQNTPVLPFIQQSAASSETASSRHLHSSYQSTAEACKYYLPAIPLLTAWLMRNKPVHQQAEHLRQRKNQKAWETTARRWTSHAGGKTRTICLTSYPMQEPNASRLLYLDCRTWDAFSFEGVRSPHSLQLAVTPEQPHVTEFAWSFKSKR